MSILEKVTPCPRKITTIFYLIDTSESMKGSKIDCLNDAMRKCPSLLESVGEHSVDSEIKVAVMQFSDGCRWITSDYETISADDWDWSDLVASGKTDLGDAFEELNNKLSKNSFMKSPMGAYAPIIVLISDGGPTDDWQKALRKLQSNNWFKHAIKLAIDIDSGSDRFVLEEFTGSKNTILNANDHENLKQYIWDVSKCATEFQCKSKVLGNKNDLPIEDAESIINTIEKRNKLRKRLPDVKANITEPEIGPKDFLVRRSSFICMNKNHTLENIHALITVLSRDRIEFETKVLSVPAAYCRNCNIYFILESTYQKICSYGIPVCRISDEKAYLKNNSYNGMKLAQESILMQYGYNVNQEENMSDSTRQHLLALLVDNEILSKSDIVSYLDFFINQRRGRSQYRIAISKWERDRDFINSYQLGTYRKVQINGIYRKL